MYERDGTKLKGYYCGPHDQLNCDHPKCVQFEKEAKKQRYRKLRRQIAKKILKEE